jgi:hypothetical protein
MRIRNIHASFEPFLSEDAHEYSVMAADQSRVGGLRGLQVSPADAADLPRAFAKETR